MSAILTGWQTRRLRAHVQTLLAMSHHELLVGRIECLAGEDLHRLAVECLHAQNRRAKHLHGTRFEDWDTGATYYTGQRETQDRIYELKDRLLTRLVYHRRAAVFCFDLVREAGWVCSFCERSWGGRQNSECFECGTPAEPDYREETWHVVEIYERRFHVPPDNSDLERYAGNRIERIPAHEPTQEPREIPTVEIAGRQLSDEMQLWVIERAIESLPAPRARYYPEPEPMPASERYHCDLRERLGREFAQFFGLPVEVDWGRPRIVSYGTSFRVRVPLGYASTVRRHGVRGPGDTLVLERRADGLKVCDRAGKVWLHRQDAA